MTIAQTNTLWEIKVHKIHIKEWASVKDEILGMVPWDNKKKQQPQITWTDYHIQGGDYAEHHEVNNKYEPKFLSVIKPYLNLFLQESEYKFCDISRCWLQRYAKGDYHALLMITDLLVMHVCSMLRWIQKYMVLLSSYNLGLV